MQFHVSLVLTSAFGPASRALRAKRLFAIWTKHMFCLLFEHWIARKRSLKWVNTAFFKLNALISSVFFFDTKQLFHHKQLQQGCFNRKCALISVNPGAPGEPIKKWHSIKKWGGEIYTYIYIYINPLFLDRIGPVLESYRGGIGDGRSGSYGWLGRSR